MIDGETVAQEPAVKDIPQDTGGTGSAAPESEQSGQDRAGASQEAPEGGSEENNQTRRRGTSPFSTIRELKAKLREQESTFNSRFQELEARLEKNAAPQNGDESSKPRKTFWEDPDGAIDLRFSSRLTEMEERLAKRWDEKQTALQETSAWHQETSEAAKLIQSQKGITPEDIEDITEIVRSKQKSWSGMGPMERAETALLLWAKSKGIADKSALKAQASSVTGAPPGPGGKRQWTEAEMNRELAKFPNDPGKFTDAQKKESDALDAEFKDAYLNGRVRK